MDEWMSDWNIAFVHLTVSLNQILSLFFMLSVSQEFFNMAVCPRPICQWIENLGNYF